LNDDYLNKITEYRIMFKRFKFLMRSFLIYISVLFVAVDILLADKQITDSISPERSTVLKLEANGKSARSYNWMVVTGLTP
jgi:hypothetical protein